MSYPIYQVPAGDVLPILFNSFNSAGASVTITGLAVTDIEIYKDGGTTQRASDAGYTLLDTDGIDFDGLTGIHGFSIDTGDNTDAGFYTVGAWFHVVVSAVTIDGQTVSFIAAAFRIMAAEGVAGVPDANTTHVADTAQTAGDLKASIDTRASQAAVDTIDDFLDTEIASIQADTDNIQTRLPAGLIGGRMDSNAQVVADKTGYGLSAAAIQAIWDALTSALTTAGSIGKLLLDNLNAAVSSRASQASLDTLDDYVDTEVAAIKAKTDQLTFTNANKVDSSLLAVADLAAAVANKIADHVLRRTYANARVSADGDALNFRSLLGAIGKLVNKWAISGTTLTVYQEDDLTSTAPGGTQTLTGTAGADPITTMDTN